MLRQRHNKDRRAEDGNHRQKPEWTSLKARPARLQYTVRHFSLSRFSRPSPALRRMPLIQRAAHVQNGLREYPFTPEAAGYQQAAYDVAHATAPTTHAMGVRLAPSTPQAKEK